MAEKTPAEIELAELLADEEENEIEGTLMEKAVAHIKRLRDDIAYIQECDDAFDSGILARIQGIEADAPPYTKDESVFAACWMLGWDMQDYEMQLQSVIIRLINGEMIPDEELKELLECDDASVMEDLEQLGEIAEEDEEEEDK